MASSERKLISIKRIGKCSKTSFSEVVQVPNYMVRVELHKASSDDYAQLHYAMAQRGFSRTILGSDGQKYHLPTAEYDVSTSWTIAQVREAGKAAAATTGKGYWVLVSEYSNCGWSGLPKAS